MSIPAVKETALPPTSLVPAKEETTSAAALGVGATPETVASFAEETIKTKCSLHCKIPTLITSTADLIKRAVVWTISLPFRVVNKIISIFCNCFCKAEKKAYLKEMDAVASLKDEVKVKLSEVSGKVVSVKAAVESIDAQIKRLKETGIPNTDEVKTIGKWFDGLAREEKDAIYQSVGKSVADQRNIITKAISKPLSVEELVEKGRVKVAETHNAVIPQYLEKVLKLEKEKQAALIEDHEKDLTKFQNGIKAAEDKLASLQKEGIDRGFITEKKADLVEKKADLSEKKVDLDDKKADLSEKKANLDDKKANLDDKKADLSEKKANLDDKKANLVEKKADLTAKEEVKA